MAFKRDEYHELCIWKTSEAVAHRCSVKKAFLEISKNSQKNTCLFFNKVAGLRVATLSKKSLWHGCFPVNFCEVSKNTFSYRTPPVAASETLPNKWPIEAAARMCSSKKVFVKNSQISQVFSREICEMFTFSQNNSSGCFLTQLLLHRKTHFSEIARGIRLVNHFLWLWINWLTFIYYLLSFCILSCNSFLKSHRSGYQWCSTKKEFRNIHRKALVFLVKKEAY